MSLSLILIIFSAISIAGAVFFILKSGSKVLSYSSFSYPVNSDTTVGYDAPNVFMDAPTVATSSGFLYKSVAGNYYYSSDMSPENNGGVFNKITIDSNGVIAIVDLCDIFIIDLKNGGFFEYKYSTPSKGIFSIYMNTATVQSNTQFLAVINTVPANFNYSAYITIDGVNSTSTSDILAGFHSKDGITYTQIGNSGSPTLYLANGRILDAQTKDKYNFYTDGKDGIWINDKSDKNYMYPYYYYNNNFGSNYSFTIDKYGIYCGNSTDHANQNLVYLGAGWNTTTSTPFVYQGTASVKSNDNGATYSGECNYYICTIVDSNTKYYMLEDQSTSNFYLSQDELSYYQIDFTQGTLTTTAAFTLSGAVRPRVSSYIDSNSNSYSFFHKENPININFH